MTSCEEARASLPKELRPIFDQLVEEYKFHATVIHRSRMYAPKILAELVREGWRNPEKGDEPNTTGIQSREDESPSKQQT